MKILIVHNNYGKYSGEEAVVDRFIAGYRGSGHDVKVFRRSSRDRRGNFWGNVHGFFSGMFSLSGVLKMRRALKRFKPDLVHVHNLYPFISPAALFPCRRAGVPVIMTVHNYRLVCPTGLFLRNNRPCEKCLERGTEWFCTLHNCEGSFVRSLGYTLRNIISRQTRSFLDCVTYFCCLTEFQRAKLIESGIPAEKIRVFPNYGDFSKRIDTEALKKEPPVTQFNHYVGYVGRLSKEKGYDLLLEVARRHPEIQFCFAGQMRESDVFLYNLPNVVFTGLLNKEQLKNFYYYSRFIVVPSRCYEGFPLVVLEAALYERPCIMPNHGPFPEIIKHEENRQYCLFNPLSVRDLERKVVTLWNNPQLAEHIGVDAFEGAHLCYDEEVLSKKMEAFVQSVVSKKKK